MPQGYVIGLASLPGAGKEELSQALTKLGVEHLHIGTVVRATATENEFVPTDDSREAYLPFWSEHANNHGQDWIAQLALRTAAESGLIILLDGVRIPQDAEAIRDANNGRMVWLEGNLAQLAQRVVSRRRQEDIGITGDQYTAKMEKDLADQGNFSMGAVRNASGLFLLPTPEIQDPEDRKAYYNRLACHVLDICNLDLNSI